MATPDPVRHAATQQTHIPGLHLLVSLGLTAPSFPLPNVLTCLLPVQPPARYEQKGDTQEEALRRAHICHLSSLHIAIFLWVINTHFQNHSSWMLFESGQTCPAFEKHTHTSSGAVCFPPTHATPEMERRWVGFYRGFSTPSVFTDCGTKTPHYCSLDSIVKRKLKWYTLKQTKTKQIGVRVGQGEGLPAAKETH